MINLNIAEFSAAYGTKKQLPPPERREVVFCGRSNVGKSTLINKILNRKALARTSSVPGKTATVNLYSVGKDPERIYFVDLPGYGYAKAAKAEQERINKLIGGYFDDTAERRRDLRLVMLLIDVRRAENLAKSDNDDRLMLEFLADRKLPFAVVATKSDKPNKTEYEKNIAIIKDAVLDVSEDANVVPFSSLKNIGTDVLCQLIFDTLSNH